MSIENASDKVQARLKEFQAIVQQLDQVKQPERSLQMKMKTVVNAIEKIKVELHERVNFYLKEKRLVEAQRIEQRTKFDIEMLNEIGFCKGIENYSRHLSGRNPGDPGTRQRRPLPAWSPGTGLYG